MASKIQPKVRLATREDSDEIYRLLLELAEYEKMKDAIHISAEDFKRDGFGENSCFRCLVINDMTEDGKIIEGKLIAQCTFYSKYESRRGRALELEDVYVTPRWRKHKLGLQFAKALAKIAIEENCVSITGGVLGWNQLARDFYEKLGARNRTDRDNIHCFMLDSDNLRKLATSS